ncbi:MAG TPA: pantetheine-phosphate adenylyltransferase [Anaerolineae bacterium]|nr:pantetheine-phosphate adenylyltransferase [Anaerolineae bacterium]HQK15113.1 pantetheine-phosphate adenylyltransferase [Anaerolineae bacterium]
MTQKIALYPGSFDPVHYGHIDIAQRAAAIFDHVIVAVYESPKKPLLFSPQERVAMLTVAMAHLPNVTVRSYRGLTVKFARSQGAHVLVRGLRVISDFEMEYQMALTNQQLGPDIDTICLMTRYEYAFLSASLVKEVFAAGGDVSQMTPPVVVEALLKKLGPRNANGVEVPSIML